MHHGESEGSLKEQLAQAHHRIAELEKLIDSARVEAEERFRGNDEVVRALFDSSLESICITDTTGTILSINDIAAHRLGRLPAQMIGRYIYDFLPPEVAKVRRVYAEQVIRTGKPVRFQDQREDRWLDNTVYPVFNPEGRTTRLLIHVEDITERKRAEEAIRETEHRFATFMDNSPAIAWMKDEHGRYVYFNKTYETVVDTPTVHRLGKTDDELWPPETAEQFKKNDREVLITGQAVQVIEETVEPDGKHRYSLNSKFLFSDVKGKKYIAGIGVDITDTKRAEEELSQALQRLDAHMNNSPLAVIEFDPELKVTRWSNEAERIFGWKSEEIIGKSISEMRWVYEEDIPFIERISGEMKHKENVSFKTVNRNYRKDGSVIDCEWYNSAIHDANGRLVSILSSVLDITKRKQAEDELNKTNARLDIVSTTASRLLMSDEPQSVVESLCRRVMEHLDCDVFFNYLVDPHKNGLRLNAWAGIPETTAREIEFLDYGAAVCGCAARDACRIVAEDIPATADPRTDLVASFGITAYACHPLLAQGKVIGTISFGAKSRTRFNEDELSLMKTVADQVATAMQRVQLLHYAEGRADELELRVRDRTAELRDSYDRLQLEMDERRRFEKLLAEARDLAVKLSATSDLHEALGLCLDAALQAGEMDFGGIYLLDPDTGTLQLQVHRNLPQTFVDQVSVLGLNSSIAHFVTDRRPVYRTYRELNLPFDFSETIRGVAILPILTESGAVGFLNTASGKTDFIPASSRVALEMIAAQIGGAIERITNEQKRTRLEQQLRQSQKMEAIGTLAGGIAHDFNNILAAILGNAELAMDDVDKNSSIRQNLNHIVKSSIRARDLVRQILTFSKISDQEQKPLNLVPVIKEAFQFLRASLPATIEMTMETSLRDDVIIGNEGQVQQIIVNLVTNAKQAMPDGGRIEISLRDASLAGSAAPDRGQPHDYILISVRDTGCGMDESVRTRIFEPFFTTRQIGQGTGLGLSVVYGIVASHDGLVTVESQPGEGSTFRVFLPKANARVEPLPEIADKIPHGKEHILFVDDEEPLCLLISQRLSRLGYAVTTASSGEEALQLFARNPRDFDLVITDQTMPSMTGLSLSKELLRIRPDVPIILSTGYSERANKNIAKEVGIREFLMKPITQKELAETVRHILNRENKDNLTAGRPSVKNRRVSR